MIVPAFLLTLSGVGRIAWNAGWHAVRGFLRFASSSPGHPAGRLCSIDRIKQELAEIGDRLCDWAKNDCPETFFAPSTDPKVSHYYSEMMNWVQSDPQFTQAAKAEFATVADGWVVAYAKTHSMKVVTHEVYAPNIKKRVKIPNVCIEFSVEYCNTFEMLQGLGVKFS